MWADVEQSFKKGVEASDLEEWKDAADHFREAIAQDPQESEKRVFISGVFSRPYVPHFYLGWSLYQLGSEHCEAALESWKISQSQGVVQNLRRQYQELQKGQKTCQSFLLPRIEDRVRRELQRGETLMQRLVGDESEVTGERQAMTAALDTARERLRASLAEDDLAGALQAEGLAREATRGLEAWLQGAESLSNERLGKAVADSRRALSEAEQAERSLLSLLAESARTKGLDDAQRQTILRREMARLELSGSSISQALQDRLNRVRTRLETTDTVDGHGQVQEDADVIATELRQLTARLQTLFTRAALERPVRSESATAIPPSELPTSARQIQASPAQGEVPKAGLVDDSRSGEPLEEAAVVRVAGRELQELRRSAVELLTLVRSVGTLEGLGGLQAERLDQLLALVAERRSDAALVGRLEVSHGALQLVAAGSAFLHGDPERTLRILELRPLPELAWAAHGYLFQAAAHYALFQRDGEMDPTLERLASEDVARCLDLQPDLVPELRVFSPSFQSFFLRSSEQQRSQKR